jgi:hypothetical protein
MTRLKKDIGDRVLVVTIFGMTLGSGYTTIMGAKEIFPTEGSGILVGLSAQVILFLLLTNTVLKSTPLRKWSIVAVLASFSIYTSYFAYYDSLASSTNIQVAYDRAVTAHQNFISKVYTPLKVRLETTVSQKANFEVQKKKEESGEGATLRKGPGDEAKKYAKKVVAADSEIADLKVIENIRKLFEYETKGLEPDKILENDRKAFAAIPNNLLASEYKNDNPIEREAYIEDLGGIKFLIPISRIKQGDRAAQLSLFFASMVDGVMIMLSTTVDKNRSRPLREAAINIANIVHDFSDGAATVLQSINADGVPFPYDRTSNETDGLEYATDYVSIKLQGKGTEFLEFFTDSIDWRTLVVDMEKLSGHSKPTFRSAYHILINALASPKRNWCSFDGTNLKISPQHREALNDWLGEELNNQARKEEALKNPNTINQTLREVQMWIPSNA